MTVEGGRVHSVLRRKLLTPVDGTRGLTIRAYDPYYYNEYTITALPRLEGAPPGCTARLIDPDLTAADTELKAELAKIPTGIDIESEYPAVGRLFAQALQIDCPK